MAHTTTLRSAVLFGLAVGAIIGLYIGHAVSAWGTQSVVAHAASSTGRIQVATAQRINLDAQSISVVTIRDMQTNREYLIVVGGQAIPLDDKVITRGAP